MAYRYTNTDKWKDVWFRKLKPIEKILFIYLCDNCDIAGFIELDTEKWAFDIGHNKGHIEGALKGLERGLIFSENNECLYICNFLKHQKNLPLKENNKAHIGILRRFELYSYKFGFSCDIENVSEFIEGATKGLQSPTCNGNGIGKGKGNDVEKSQRKTIPPKIEWIKQYCKERENNVDVNKFFDFYESKGWKVGREKMKDWQASIRTWEKSEAKSEGIHPSHKKIKSK